MADKIGLQMDSLLSSALLIPCEICHYTVVISSVKEQWATDKSSKQPFATWFMSMICCFGGGCLVNFCVGNPVLISLLNTQSLALASLIWWLVFYCPLNAFSSIVLWSPLNAFILLLKEVIRTRKILKAVKLARGVYSSSFLLCTVIGMFGACGGGILKNSAGFISNIWDKNSIKLFSFALVTKFCLLFSALYTLHFSGYITTPITTIALYQATTIYGFVLSSKLGFGFDPFALLEKMLCSVFVDYSLFTSGPDNKRQIDDSKNKGDSKKSK